MSRSIGNMATEQRRIKILVLVEFLISNSCSILRHTQGGRVSIRDSSCRMELYGISGKKGNHPLFLSRRILVKSAVSLNSISRHRWVKRLLDRSILLSFPGLKSMRHSSLRELSPTHNSVTLLFVNARVSFMKMLLSMEVPFNRKSVRDGLCWIMLHKLRIDLGQNIFPRAINEMEWRFRRVLNICEQELARMLVDTKEMFCSFGQNIAN